MLKTLLGLVLFLIFFVADIFAAGFQLKTIGAIDVTGTMSKEWWYTSPNPTLAGITTVGSSVTVNIDNVDYQATVDGSGNWSYIPTTLIDGDHNITLTSAAGSQTFTLHIGSNIPADVSAPAVPPTPVVGSTAQTLALWLGGALTLMAGIIFNFHFRNSFTKDI